MLKTFLLASTLALPIATAHAYEPSDPRPSDGSESYTCNIAREFDNMISPGAARAMSPRVLEAIRQKYAKQRQEAQVRCDEVKRDTAERQRQYDDEKAKLAAAADEARRQEAERQRQYNDRKAKLAAAADEARRQEAERAAQFAAEQKEQERIARLPINRLLTGYQLFAHVSTCNQARQGYLVQYVNDVELERARRAIKAIADQTTREDPSISTDDVWKQALKSPVFAQDVMCKNSLIQLLNSSPKTVFNVEKP